MTDLATASSAATSASAPVQEAPAAAPSPSEGSNGAETKSAPSAKDAIRAAMAKVEAASNETNQAAAVLKNGAGADEALRTEANKDLASASEAERANTEASERAKKGWETRRENQAKADTETKQTETITKTAQETAKAVAEAVKPAEQAAPAATESKYKEPPKRFVLENKADWEKVPESVRSEIDRSFKNLEKGISEHEPDAKRWRELGEYEKLSQEYYRQPLSKTLANYVELDKLMHSDPLAAFERLAGSMTYKDENGKVHNWTLKQLAQHVVDQEGVERFDSENGELKRELSALRREMAEIKNGWSERQKQDSEQRTKSVEQQIGDFAKANPRFDELFSAIEEELHNPKFAAGLDPIARLQKAYEKAERLNPAPSLSPPAPEIPSPDLEAQRRKGQASVSGAPGNGSSPAVKKPVPTSARDAIRQAMAKVGVS